MNGDLTFDNYDDGIIEAKVDLGKYFANIELYDSDSLTTRIYGNQYGGAYLYSDTGGIRAMLDANPSGGLLKLYNNTWVVFVIVASCILTSSKYSQEFVSSPGSKLIISNDRVIMSSPLP